MTPFNINRVGFWSGIILVILGLLYLGLIAVTILSGAGYPPVEPLQAWFNLLILVTAAWMVFFWSVLHQAAPAEKKLFSRASLVLIVIFAALTSINRYVALTVVRQSLAAGNTDGLQWFLPYGWPSVMLAIEMLAWGFFFGLACLCLAPVFAGGRLEKAIRWTLVVMGICSLLSAMGPVLGADDLGFNPFTMAGALAWGPGLTATVFMIVVWFRRAGVSVTD